MLVSSGLIEHAQTHVSRKPAILAEPQLSQCMLFMSKILRALLSNLLILGLLAKCFKMLLRLSYIDLVSIWQLFTDMHNRLVVSAKA